MTEITSFDDLELLDRGDLEAVFKQLPMADVVAALWGTSAAMRSRLLRNLSPRLARDIERGIAATDHLTFEQVRNAQQRTVATLCSLSRAGQIAFDMPEDMVA